MVTDQDIDNYAKMGAQQMITQYAGIAYSLGITREQLKTLIRKIAAYAVEILNNQR